MALLPAPVESDEREQADPALHAHGCDRFGEGVALIGPTDHRRSPQAHDAGPDARRRGRRQRANVGSDPFLRTRPCPALERFGRVHRRSERDVVLALGPREHRQRRGIEPGGVSLDVQCGARATPRRVVFAELGRGQDAGDLRCEARPVSRVGREQPQDELLERRGDLEAGARRDGTLDAGLLVSEQERERGCRDRGPAGEQLVEDHPDRVEVGPGPDVARHVELLGRHVDWRAGCVAREVSIAQRVLHLGHAEVGDLDLAAFTDEEVLGLEIAVDDVPSVRDGERVERVDERSLHARPPGPLAHPTRQVVPPHELHHERRATAYVAGDVEKPHDMWVLETRGRRRLTEQEAPPPLRRELGAQRLDRELDTRRAVDRTVHPAHTPFAERFDELVDGLGSGSIGTHRVVRSIDVAGDENNPAVALSGGSYHVGVWMELGQILLDLISPRVVGDEVVPGVRLHGASAELGLRYRFLTPHGVLLVDLTPLDRARELAARTARFALGYRTEGGRSAVPGELGRALCEALAELIAANEERVLEARSGTVEPDADARVRHVEVTSILELAGPSGELFYTLSPYVGCLIGCRFCYAQERVGAMRSLLGLPDVAWGSYVDVRRNAAEVLEQEMAELEPAPIKFCPVVSDPYHAIERRERVTRRCLETIARAKAPWPVLLLTRSALVLDDLDRFAALPSAWVGVSLPTVDDEVRRHFEPRAASVSERLHVLGELRRAGVRTIAVVQPILEGPLEELADALARSVSSVSIDILRETYAAAEDFADPRYAHSATEAWQLERAELLSRLLVSRGVPVWRGELPDDLVRGSAE